MEWVQILSILSVGLGIGWLTGLATSPVIGGVLGSLLAVGAGVVVAFQKIGRAKGEQNREENFKENNSSKFDLDARPAALLILGIALAAPLGILARSHRVFEPASSIKTDASEPDTSPYTGGLFQVAVKECNELLALADQENEQAFRGALIASSLPGSAELVSKIASTSTLKDIVEALCETK